MAYAKTALLVAKLGLTPSDVEEILSTYAQELEDNEPYAVNPIEAARNLALDIKASLEDE